MPRCVHCHAPRPGSKDGLCAVCYRSKEIRDIYFPDVPFGVDITDKSPLPVYPTKAPPGSKWKWAVMIARAERGMQIHHPDDFTYEESDL